MHGGVLAYALRVYLPLLLLGAAAGLVQAIGRRARTAPRRRLCQIAWILILLIGAPFWLLVATVLGWM